MNKIEITVLSARVLDALSVRGLKAKTVREFERYGTRRIVQHCLDNGQTIYFKETVQDFVWQERARMESGALPHYQWVLTRRAAVYLDQMAKHGKIQGEPLRSWEAERNPLFQSAPHSPSNSMKVIDIICRTRDAVIQLELSDKTKTNYIYCGFGPILNFFASRGEEFYSPETLALFVNKAKENYANGTIPKASFQTMRKAARWIEECLSTGRVSQRKLRKYNFACAPPEFENLLSQYQLYMDNENYLKEGTRQFYLSSVRTFFRTMGILGIYRYAEITLPDVTRCLAKISETFPCGIFNLTGSMRSFARFMAEKHPELPDISPALVFSAAKRRRVYVGYTHEDAQKIFSAINRSSTMRIIEIPASMQESARRKSAVRKLRVAAYCRVSTEEEEQQGSFEIQKLYYTEKIESTPEWEVSGIYADDGISGVHTKKRDGFNQMIQDCKKHRIDLILTKSISRFARNTLDSIQYVRMLKQMGIAVVFEKENINTATMNSEMILTVLSAFAQAESESISQNVARGKRMGYKHGKFAFPYGRIIGYKKGVDGKPEIIPEQAEIIRLIFNSYLQGDSLQSIKAKLETEGALTARGNTEWSAQSIQRILQNEKYCGDVLLQKTFTEDVLTGVHKKNTGQLPQYYIENYHGGIVSKQMFREVQAEIARRNSKSAANQRKRRRGRYNSKYALSERLVCGDCGSPYKRVTWNIHGRKQIVWRCVNRIEYGTKFCGNSPSIPEEEIHRAILKAVQDLAANFTDEVAAQINGILHDIQTGESTKPNLQEQLEQTQQEFDRLLEMSLDFDEDTPFLDDRLGKLNSKIKRLKKAIKDSAAQQEKASQPELLLSAKDLQIQEYDDALTMRIIEKITVRSRNEIEIRFIGGYKKTISLGSSKNLDSRK